MKYLELSFPAVRYLALAVAAVVGISLTLYLFYRVKEWDESRVRTEFHQDATPRVSSFHRVIVHSISDVQALVAFYASSVKVERDEFQEFTRFLLENNASIQALEWIPRIKFSERASMEAALRGEGFPRFYYTSFTERDPQGNLVKAGRRDEYYPVFYLEPLRGNEAALGYDLSSDPVRRQALERARDSGAIIATSGIKLVQETEGEFGFLLLGPVYERGAVTESVEARRGHLTGFVTGVFRIGDMVEDALSYLPSRSIDLYIFERSDSQKDRLLFAHYADRNEARTGASAVKTSEIIHEAKITIADREWLIRCVPTPGYLKARRTPQPWIALVSGLLFTGLLLGYLSVSLASLVRTRSYAGTLLRSKEELEREITVRVGVEKKLKEERDRAQTYLDVAKVMLVLIDAGQKVRMVNKQGCEILGYREEEMVGSNWFDRFIPGRDREAVRAVFIQLLAGDAGPVEYFESAVLTATGEERLIAWHNTVLKSNDGDVLGTLSSGEDITERKRLEAQLIQAQKMEAVGRLAGGVAHDFNNILTAIIGYAELLRMKMDQGDPLLTYLEHIVSASGKAANLTKGLLAFSRKQVIQPEPLDLNEIVRGVENILLPIVGEDIDLQMRLAEHEMSILADRIQIEQVLMNLTANARDEMPEGGRITIETRLIELAEKDAVEEEIERPGRYVLLTVADSGGGMDDATKGNIFEPFFTTKQIGKGTGLGLSVVYGIIKQHNGSIHVESRLGKGTTFRIYLPYVEAAAEAKHAYERQTPRGGTETILVAEDDGTVRELTKEILEKGGYTVLTAFDGADALDQFRRKGDEIDLVLLDVIMPKMNGKVVYDEIRKLSPGTKVMFISGYDEDLMEQKGIFEEKVRFLIKPVMPDHLLAETRKVLDMDPSRDAAA